MQNDKLSFIQKTLPASWTTTSHDLLIAFSWAAFLGFPLFIVHMMLFDYEHDMHLGIPFSVFESLVQLFPRHIASLVLWLAVTFVATYAIRRNLQQQVMLAHAQTIIQAAHTQAMIDGLTGVWNRQGFENLLAVMDSQARQRNCPYTILMSDVDKLKNYNDTFGHPMADQAIKQLIQILSSQIRSSDAIARFGGDEFAILCLGLNQEEAECLVDRLEEAVSHAPITMSFGAATFPNDGDDSKVILEVADERMYLAKERKPVTK